MAWASVASVLVAAALLASSGEAARRTLTRLQKLPHHDFTPWVAKATEPPTQTALISMRKMLHKQPDRCTTHVQTLGALGTACKGFSADCASTATCNSDFCYEGKCAMGPTCQAHGKKCFAYAPHVCCTGECEGVSIRADCLRLLGLSDDISTHRGINVDRQCENIGTCKHWPGAPVPPAQTTPWAVTAGDLASKYWNLKGVTFATDAKVDTSQYISRQEGQTREGIAPDSTEPGIVRDAGLLFFTSDTEVSPELWGKYEAAPEDIYCIAPIVRGGVGGAFYAIGKNCCDKEFGFTCGDVSSDGPSGKENVQKSCLVIASHQDKYTYARQELDVRTKGEYFGPGKGINTELPIFCRWVEDPVAEAAPKDPLDTFYTFKTLAATMYCVAPIVDSKGLPSPQQFWSVGINCCSVGGGFHCGDAGKAGAHSGVTDVDASGMFFMSVKMGEIRYGWKTVPRPMFVQWTAKTLVATPGGMHVEIDFGKGVVGVTSADR